MITPDPDRRQQLLLAMHALTVAAQRVFDVLEEAQELTFLEMSLMDELGRTIRATRRIAEHN